MLVSIKIQSQPVFNILVFVKREDAKHIKYCCEFAELHILLAPYFDIFL